MYNCEGEKCKGKKIGWCEGMRNIKGGQKERAKARSKTFPGIAKAMADQWGKSYEEVQGMKIMVKYLRFFEEFGRDDFEVVEFKNATEAYAFYNNIISDDKSIWIGDNMVLQYKK